MCFKPVLNVFWCVSVFRHIVCDSAEHTPIDDFRIESACGGQFLLDDFSVADIYHTLARNRHVRVVDCQDADYRYADLRNDISDTGDDVQRNALSDREHACSLAVVRSGDTGKMVHRGHEKNNDRGCAGEVCDYRDSDNVRTCRPVFYGGRSKIQG